MLAIHTQESQALKSHARCEIENVLEENGQAKNLHKKDTFTIRASHFVREQAKLNFFVNLKRFVNLNQK